MIISKLKEEKLRKENVVKTAITTIGSFLASLLGVLYIPVLLLVLSNVIDYVTGLFASPYRKQDINSYKSIRGITKKVGMWLLVVVGAIIDELIVYSVETIGFVAPFTFLVACVVAIWLVCNECISILENLKDMGVKIPTFLQPLLKNIRSQAESKFEAEKDEAEKND